MSLLNVNCLSCWGQTDILFSVTLGFRPQPDRSITLSVALTVGFLGIIAFCDWMLYRWMNCLRNFERSQCFRPRILLKINLPESFETPRAAAVTTQYLIPEYANFEVDSHELLPWNNPWFYVTKHNRGRSQRPCGLRHRSAAARLLRLWVRIPPGHGFLSVVSVVFCQVEVSSTSWSLFQRSPTDIAASCVI